jgi:hypothetical protein
MQGSERGGDARAGSRTAQEETAKNRQDTTKGRERERERERKRELPGAGDESEGELLTVVGEDAERRQLLSCVVSKSVPSFRCFSAANQRAEPCILAVSASSEQALVLTARRGVLR